MSDIVIDTIEVEEGIILMINPPSNYDEKISLRFINKISKEDETSFLFPATYGRFDCMEGKISSNEVYYTYGEIKSKFSQENIFVFETLTGLEEGNNYSLNTLAEYVKEIIYEQNKIKTIPLSIEFESLIQRAYYKDFLEEFSFTASEIIILRGLFKYAFLSGLSIEVLINETRASLDEKANRKLRRKEFINVLRQRLS